MAAPKASPQIDRLRFERELFAAEITAVAGVDEAGRGPLAGPVVAAAVMLPKTWILAGVPPDLAGLNDSKQLTASQRETFFTRLTTEAAIRFAISVVPSEIIDSINILQATHRAMNQALQDLRPAPAHVLVDGLRVKSLCYPQTPIVKGDSLSYSIAAASILAKVTRDRMMMEYDARFPAYGFADHKGYGTARHLEAISLHGPCPIHRRSFAPLKQPEPELFPSA